MTTQADPLREALEQLRTAIDAKSWSYNFACDDLFEKIDAIAALAQSPAPQSEGGESGRIAELERDIAHADALYDSCSSRHRAQFKERADGLRAELSRLRDEQPKGGEYLGWPEAKLVHASTAEYSTFVPSPAPQGEELEQLRLIAEENADNVRLLDYIADKIGLSKEEELTRDNFRQWLQSVAPQGEGMREALDTLRATLYPFQKVTQAGFKDDYVVRLGDGITTGQLRAVSIAVRNLAMALATPIPSDRAGREEEIARECVDRIIEKWIAAGWLESRHLNHPEIRPLVEAEITAALRQSASAGIERAAEWQPIETAPRNGRHLLLTRSDSEFPVVACFGRRHIQLDGEWLTVLEWEPVNFVPEFWMYAPSTPRSLSPSASRE